MTPAATTRSSVRSVHPRRVAVLSVHTSPLDQPGTGDAGGLNVYVVETSKRLAELGVEVEVFTRATRSDLPPTVELAPGETRAVEVPLEWRVIAEWQGEGWHIASGRYGFVLAPDALADGPTATIELGEKRLDASGNPAP